MVGPPSDVSDQMAAFLFGGLNMKCPKCNANNKDTYTKCKKCGQLLVEQKTKEVEIEGIPPYNWVPAAIVISLFVVAILIIKVYLKY